MRRLQRFIVLFLSVMLLPACGKKQAVESSLTPPEISAAIISSQNELPHLNSILPGENDFSFYLSTYYQIDGEQVRDGVICYADDVEASEIAILVLADESTAATIRDTLTAYIERRAGDFSGYAPEQEALVENGIVVVNGRYVALLICGNTKAAQTAFLNCFSSDDPDSTTAGTESKPPVSAAESAYNAKAVLDAWQSGDTSSLSDYDTRILQAAENIIEQIIADSMTDYEKELAIHDWITGWSSFDMGAFSHAPGSNEGTDSDTPYGVLINKRGNCWGYSSTFQLFMDMLDIKCITVYGLPRSNGAEHAWNQVCLDGEWYCVDTAWDDPIGGKPGHTYFNVTTEYLRNSGIHQWDETNVPEATGTTYRYNP